MSLDAEKLNRFHGRMNEWVARQGIFFQLTHAGGGGIFRSMGAVLLRLALLAALAAAVLAAWMFWRAGQPEFKDELEASARGYFGTEEISLSGTRRGKETFMVSNFSGRGGKGELFREGGG